MITPEVVSTPLIESMLFITGVRKSGTTTVYDSLCAWPGIRAPSVKEPQFFCLSSATVNENFSWYQGLWPVEGAGLRIDGSTLYYQFPEAYQNIGRYVAHPAFICCLRDPAKRFYSAYWHLKAKPGGVEKRSFEAVLTAYEQALKETGDPLRAEQLVLDGAVTDQLIDPNYLGPDYLRTHYGAPFTTDLPDRLIFFRYLQESSYSLNYASFLNQAATHLVLFERLLKMPGEELEQISAFLKATYAGEAGKEWAEKDFLLAPNNNRTLDANQSVAMRTLTKFGLYDTVKRLLNDRQKQWVKKHFYGGIPSMTQTQYQRTRAMLESEYAFWAEAMPQTRKLWQY